MQRQLHHAQVLPLHSGCWWGSISFVAPDGQYAWYSLEVRASTCLQCRCGRCRIHARALNALHVPLWRAPEECTDTSRSPTRSTTTCHTLPCAAAQRAPAGARVAAPAAGRHLRQLPMPPGGRHIRVLCQPPRQAAAGAMRMRYAFFAHTSLECVMTRFERNGAAPAVLVMHLTHRCTPCTAAALPAPLLHTCARALAAARALWRRQPGGAGRLDGAAGARAVSVLLRAAAGGQGGGQPAPGVRRGEGAL